MLTLLEELMLLALDNDKGKMVSSASMAIPFGLSGAAIFELHLADKIQLREKKVVVSDSKPCGDAILDDVQRMIQESSKPRTLNYWINRLHSKCDLQRRTIDRLVEKKILKHEEHHVFWVFPVQRYPEGDPHSELDVRQRMRAVVLKGEKPDIRTIVLLSLVNACSLITELFGKEKAKEAKKRIDHLTENEPVGKAIKDAVEGVQAAVIAAAVAASVSVTSTTS